MMRLISRVVVCTSLATPVCTHRRLYANLRGYSASVLLFFISTFQYVPHVCLDNSVMYILFSLEWIGGVLRTERHAFLVGAFGE